MAPKSFTSSADGVELEALQRYQPAFPRALYRSVYEYHTDAGASWFNAWDVMTGEGLLAVELSKYFNTVWATDPSSSNIALAVKYLSEQPHAHNKVSFAVRQPEDALPTPAHNLDAVAIGNAIHNAADPDRVIAVAADMLKSNGTLAMWVCGHRFFFLDEKHRTAQTIMDEAFRKWMTASYKKTATTSAQVLASRLDSIELKEELWENVRRIHWNRDRSMVGEPDSRVSTLPSKVGDADTVETRSDSDFMSVAADLDWIINYMNGLNTKIQTEEVCGEEFVRLAKELGGRNQKVQIAWPLTLCLATKR